MSKKYEFIDKGDLYFVPPRWEDSMVILHWLADYQPADWIFKDDYVLFEEVDPREFNVEGKFDANGMFFPEVPVREAFLFNDQRMYKAFYIAGQSACR